ERDPVALGVHADDLRVGVLRHHAHELAPVTLGHPILGLDALAGGDSGLELGHLRGIVLWGWARLRHDGLRWLASGLGNFSNPSNATSGKRLACARMYTAPRQTDNRRRRRRRLILPACSRGQR